MKFQKLYCTVIALMGMVTSAYAGHCGAAKSCGCAPSCQPACSRPVICKPACPNVFTYQRGPACKPVCGYCPANTCCKPACGPMGCGPMAGQCGPAAGQCGPAAAACAPACTAPAAAACAPACTAPAATNCGPVASTCAPACAAPARSCAPACGAPARTCAPACAAPVSCSAPAKCCKPKCCTADCYEVAHWIYVSQTACHGKCRAKAVDYLGDHYDCQCNPEIMSAFIYALNDADERVRKEAADEIGDQLKKNPCCLNDALVCALTAALGDCDCGVVRKAERALCIAGYDVQDCCQTCSTCTASTCNTVACGPGVGAPAMGAPAPAHSEPAPAPPMPEAAPAPAPESATEKPEPEAYFPSRLKNQQTKVRKNGLSNLFGLAN